VALALGKVVLLPKRRAYLSSNDSLLLTPFVSLAINGSHALLSISGVVCFEHGVTKAVREQGTQAVPEETMFHWPKARAVIL